MWLPTFGGGSDFLHPQLTFLSLPGERSLRLGGISAPRSSSFLWPARYVWLRKPKCGCAWLTVYLVLLNIEKRGVIKFDI